VKTWLRRLCEFSAPSIENIRIGPELDTEDYDYELKPSLINRVQAITFNGKKNEDASAHLQNFLEICSTVVIKNISQEVMLLHLFSFSLDGRAKQWFYASKDQIKT
jgi:hypothetical protein